MGVEMRLFIFALLLSVGPQLFAATPFKRSLTQKKNSYMKDGVFIGGKAGNGTTLLGVRRAFSNKAHLERVIVDVADNEGKAPGAALGYFQASVDAKQNRVILDLAQLKQSRVSEQKIKDMFKASPFVASVEFTLDPEDKAGTMVLNLKRPMQLEVFELLDGHKPGRIVMDLTPARATRIKGHL
jgi:hypothetical protein